MLGVAHRGGNDLAGMAAAAALGADIIEADVHLHRGRLEVRHKKTLHPLPWLWDQGQLHPKDPQQLVLDELLDALPVGTPVMLDLKGISRVGAETLGLLRARSHEHPLLVCARWWPSVRPFRSAHFAKVLYSVRGRTELSRLRRALHRGDAPDGISIHLSLLTPSLVQEIHERVPLILTWPVDDPASLTVADKVGVDGVITKDLEILRTVVTTAR